MAPSGWEQRSNNTIAILSMLDCASTAAPGIVFDLDALGPKEKIFYLVNGLPSPAATQTDVTGSRWSSTCVSVPVPVPEDRERAGERARTRSRGRFRDAL
jgi:hypothetical protein